MDNTVQDGFVVFVRNKFKANWQPETAEQVVATCPSYDEAVEVREKFRQPGRTYIIRCVGETGGGD